MFTVNEVIDLGIRIEKNGQRFYRRAVTKMESPSLRTLLELLADDELRHIEWLEELRSRRGGLIDESRHGQVEGLQVGELLGRQSFSLDDLDFSDLDRPESLITAAIEFENDTILFYEMLEMFVVAAGALASLKKIIAEEKRHIRYLEQYGKD